MRLRTRWGDRNGSWMDGNINLYLGVLNDHWSSCKMTAVLERVTVSQMSKSSLDQGRNQQDFNINPPGARGPGRGGKGVERKAEQPRPRRRQVSALPLSVWLVSSIHSLSLNLHFLFCETFSYPFPIIPLLLLSLSGCIVSSLPRTPIASCTCFKTELHTY